VIWPLHPGEGVLIGCRLRIQQPAGWRARASDWPELVARLGGVAVLSEASKFERLCSSGRSTGGNDLQPGKDVQLAW